MRNKKRFKYHKIANAQKRTKRHKQKHYNREILPIVLAKQEDKRRRKALSERLEKDLKKIQVISKKGIKVASKKDHEVQKKKSK